MQTVALPNRLLKADEAAQRLDISKDRFYDLCRRGLLPHVRIGRSIRVDARTLEDWVSRGGTANGQDSP